LIKETIEPSFKPEVQLNIKNFSRPFEHPKCKSDNIKNDEDIKRIIEELN
jgi:hypothetical protein